MAEIGTKDIANVISKVQEICPRSEISRDDCEQFWKDVFGQEIKVKDLGGLENEDTSMSGKLTDAMKDFWNNVFSEPISEQTVEEKQEGLTQEQKDIIKEETGWSNEIINAIQSMDEYKIYKTAGLIEGEVNDKKCLMRTDINWEQKDQFGITNRERVAEGYAPLDITGKPIQLHHIGQHADSPLAELTFKEHRTGGNDTILHDKNKETEVHGEGNNWDNERKDYWQNRQLNGGENNE